MRNYLKMKIWMKNLLFSNGTSATTKAVNTTLLKRKNESVFEKTRKKFKADEQVGPSVAEDLAALAKEAFTTPMDECRLKEIKDEIKRPDNCEMLQNVQVDMAIWHHLPINVRNRDKGFQTVQSNIAKAGAGLVSLLDKLKKSTIISDKDDVDEYKEGLLSESASILACLGQAHFQLAMKRRQLISNSFESDYRNLCSNKTTSLTTELFGGDVITTIDALTKSNRLSKKAAIGRGRGFVKRGQRGFSRGRGFNSFSRDDQYNNNWYPYSQKGRSNRGSSVRQGFRGQNKSMSKQ